jgi:hypothetical protein
MGRRGLERRNRRCVVIVGGVQKSNDDARVDDDQRHSCRNLARYPRR